jgi:hypothetical protein
MNALAATHDATVQMIDTSIIRVHQHAACIARNKRQSMGQSRGHAVVERVNRLLSQFPGRFCAPASIEPTDAVFGPCTTHQRRYTG